MSIDSQFNDDATSVKRNIEAAYDDGADDVQDTEKEASTMGSPLCIV